MFLGLNCEPPQKDRKVKSYCKIPVSYLFIVEDHNHHSFLDVNPIVADPYIWPGSRHRLFSSAFGVRTAHMLDLGTLSPFASHMSYCCTSIWAFFGVNAIVHGAYELWKRMKAQANSSDSVWDPLQHRPPKWRASMVSTTLDDACWASGSFPDKNSTKSRLSRDMFKSVRLMILMVNHDFPGPDTPINQLGFQTPRYEIGERGSKLTSPLIVLNWIDESQINSEFFGCFASCSTTGYPFFQIPGGWGFKAEVSVDDLGKLLHLCICCSSVAKPIHQFLAFAAGGPKGGTDS